MRHLSYRDCLTSPQVLESEGIGNSPDWIEAQAIRKYFKGAFSSKCVTVDRRGLFSSMLESRHPQLCSSLFNDQLANAVSVQRFRVFTVDNRNGSRHCFFQIHERFRLSVPGTTPPHGFETARWLVYRCWYCGTRQLAIQCLCWPTVPEHWFVSLLSTCSILYLCPIGNIGVRGFLLTPIPSGRSLDGTSFD